jgi:hypothetical protein
MTRLILTFHDSGAGGLKGAGLADCVIPLGLKFVWGRLQSRSELDTLLSSRSAMRGASTSRWLDNLTDGYFKDARRQGLGLIEFCERFDAVELWVDPDPNAQLQMIWLLDYLRRHAKAALDIALVQADATIGNHPPEELERWRLPTVKILNDHLETASVAWQAYRASTPQDWFDLLGKDLSVLPQLRQTVLELLEELPADKSGLGATEMRMLELISTGNAGPFDVFPGHAKPNKRRVFGYWEIGYLLDGLARCSVPAVSGLDEGPFTEAMLVDRDRHQRYKSSKLKLTALGEAILAQTDDFSRHNPMLGRHRIDQ